MKDFEEGYKKGKKDVIAEIEEWIKNERRDFEWDEDCWEFTYIEKYLSKLEEMKGYLNKP